MVLKPIKKYFEFIWRDETPLAYILFIITIIVMIRFFLPIFFTITSNTIGLTDVLAVVSGSMKHDLFTEERYYNFFEEKNFTRNEINEFPFNKGLDIGDLVIIWKIKPENLKIGDVIVFNANNIQIIHRINKIREEEGTYYFTTKGDNNPHIITPPKSRSDLEGNIHESRIVGKTVFRIKFLGLPRTFLNNLFNINTGQNNFGG